MATLPPALPADQHSDLKNPSVSQAPPYLPPPSQSVLEKKTVNSKANELPSQVKGAGATKVKVTVLKND